MRILMVTPYLPYPPASGGQIRTFNLLRYLSKKNQITLVALYKNNSEKEYLPYLKKYCNEIYLCKKSEKPWQFKNILKSIFSFHPFLIIRNFSKEARDVLIFLLEKNKFDVIHTETFYVMPHIPQTEIPVLLVEQTIEFKVYQHFVDALPWFFRLFLSLDISKLKYWEKFYWKKAALVATVSESDKKIVSQVEPKIKPIVIPNGASEEMTVERLGRKNFNNPLILFQGNFFWLQNVEAANYLIERVYPELKKELPDIKVLIAGQNAKRISKPIPDKRSLNVVDISHDDIETVKKLYSDATLFVAPIFGPGGTRLKILAAMASGLPVVSTRTGIEGLELKDGEHVLIANNPKEFAEKTKLILSDNKIYEKIRKNAYFLVKEKYNWEIIAQKLEISYRKIQKSL